MIKDCLKGKHKLESITELSHWDGSAQVVRWCSICGSIVIDTQIDHRIFPGQVMPMKSPEHFKNEIN